MSEYALLCRLILEMSGENTVWDNGGQDFCRAGISVCDQKGAVLRSVYPPMQKIDTMETGANYTERNS